MNDVATIQQPKKGKLLTRFAERFGVDEGKLMTTLKQTAFRQKNGEVSNEQMMALMVVADQYQLNPFTKEIYAFPDKQNGIVPVVGVDGWSRIINSHPQFDGMDFRQSESNVEQTGAKPCPEWIECVMYRKDRDHPIVVREYLDECYRPPFKGQGNNGSYEITGPWQTHTKRFLRHKTMIQCARIAFGFAGIYDQDEAERIQEAQSVEPVETTPSQPARETYTEDQFKEKLPAWEGLVKSGAKTPQDIINVVGSRVDLTEQQKRVILNLGAEDADIEGESNENTES